MTGRRLRIAMIGGRGVPATFGGVERVIEEVGSRLAARGHHVVVYCRADYLRAGGTGSTHRGMELRVVPTVHSKHLEAFVHSAVAAADSRRRAFDIAHFHGLGPGVFTPVASIGTGTKTVLTVHGRDDQRAKWGGPAQAVLRLAEVASSRLPDATAVVSYDLRSHYWSSHRRRAHYVPNGVDAATRTTEVDRLERFGVRPGRYVLFVGRLVPEKQVDVLIKAFRLVDADVKLVVAGGSSHTDAYVEEVQRLAAADARVVLTGYVYGQDLAQLYSHAAAFALPSELEGLPLALLEAISYGLPIVASEIRPHCEVLRHPGGHVLVPVGDEVRLAAGIEKLVAGVEGGDVDASALRADVLGRYSWDEATDATEQLYARLLGPSADEQRVT